MRLHLIPVAIVALLVAPCAAAASNFTVSPTAVNLSASATSALVTLRNSSKVPLRFEVTLVSWTIEPRDGGSRITLRHDGWDEAGLDVTARDDHAAYWAGYLQDLRDVLEEA